MLNKVISKALHFTPFNSPVDGIELPKKFTFPFYYEPHPLCILAAKELQKRIENQKDWKHDFGLNNHNNEDANGKMFGVLVVQKKGGEIGYLSAVSGKLNNTKRPENFVPYVYNLPQGENFFTRDLKVINALGEEIRALEASPEKANAKAEWQKTETELNAKIEEFRAFMREKKKDRKARRLANEGVLSDEEFKFFMKDIVRESYHYRHELKRLVADCQSQIDAKKEKFLSFENKLVALIDKRANCSAVLQKKLFDSYQFLNIAGEKKSLNDIFNKGEQPPAGAGDCAAPKLLHYAFANGLKPLAMAEFWWGVSPASTIRKHLNFYPACKNKCEPILKHMLAGMEVDPNPMLADLGQKKKLEIVFEDEFLLVVNKPVGLLSVPGKEVQDSVATRMKEKYPEATGPLVVHRLDMATSGLLLIAKSLEVHKHLQEQFSSRTIKKRYVAILEGEIKQNKGLIKLPLRADLDNRPSQLVCYEHGKLAVTRYEVLEKKDGKTRINLFPHTGRTHQLRMHMAHQLGLNTAIVGDALYGKIAERMYLHAEYLQFIHPVTSQKMRVTAKADF